MLDLRVEDSRNRGKRLQIKRAHSLAASFSDLKEMRFETKVGVFRILVSDLSRRLRFRRDCSAASQLL